MSSHLLLVGNSAVPPASPLDRWLQALGVSSLFLTHWTGHSGLIEGARQTPWDQYGLSQIRAHWDLSLSAPPAGPTDPQTLAEFYLHALLDLYLDGSLLIPVRGNLQESPAGPLGILWTAIDLTTISVTPELQHVFPTNVQCVHLTLLDPTEPSNPWSLDVEFRTPRVELVSAKIGVQNLTYHRAISPDGRNVGAWTVIMSLGSGERTETYPAKYLKEGQWEFQTPGQTKDLIQLLFGYPSGRLKPQPETSVTVEVNAESHIVNRVEMTIQMELSAQESLPVKVKFEDLDQNLPDPEFMDPITLRHIVPSQISLWEEIGAISLQGRILNLEEVSYQIQILGGPCETAEFRVAEGVNLTDIEILYTKYRDSTANISIHGGLHVGRCSMQITGDFEADSEWDLETDCYGVNWDFELEQMIQTFLNEEQSLKLRMLIQKGQLNKINYRLKLTGPILECYINLLIGEGIQNQILQLRLSVHRETREVRLTIPSDEARELLSQILNRGKEYPRDMCIFNLDVEPGGQN